MASGRTQDPMKSPPWNSQHKNQESPTPTHGDSDHVAELLLRLLTTTQCSLEAVLLLPALGSQA